MQSRIRGAVTVSRNYYATVCNSCMVILVSPSLSVYPFIHLFPSLSLLLLPTLFITVSLSLAIRLPIFLPFPSLFIFIFLFLCFSRARLVLPIFFCMRNSLYAPIIALASR